MPRSHISATDARRSLSKLLNRAAYGDERIVIRKHGEPIAAVISIDDLHLLEQLEDVAAALQADRDVDAGEVLDWEMMRGEL